MANRVIQRDEVKDAFRPIIPLFEAVIAEARLATTFRAVVAANPEVMRDSHIHRLEGTKRWMLVADGLVDRAAEMPERFTVVSSEEDHNGGRYVFGFPGGVFTVRQHPHQVDEGAYLQMRLDQVLEQAPLADGIDAFADLKVFLSVPAKAGARLIVTHAALDEQMVILLDEISAEDMPVSIAPRKAKELPSVRSSIRPEVEIVKSIDDLS